MNPYWEDTLIINFLNSETELIYLEQDSYLDAKLWALGTPSQILLTEEFVRKLHKKMFEKFRKNAGNYRTAPLEGGVSWNHIPIELPLLLDDALSWITQKTYTHPKASSNFFFRFIKIAPFSFGNELHAKILTDLLNESID